MAMLPHLTGTASTSTHPSLPKLRSRTPCHDFLCLANPFRTVETVAVTLWGGSEGAITIIAASIPVLRTLFRSDKLTSTTARYGATDERRLNTTSRETFATSRSRGEKDVDVYVHAV